MLFTPSRAALRLGGGFHDPVDPADFPAYVLRFRNDRAAADVGLELLSNGEWIDHFSRFEALPGSIQIPRALRYHGHQFRTYNPELGDGRGFLFAQLRDRRGRLLDLGTKGSGRTPYSRFGDGRLTLKGGVREVLATEMLEALGVPTSRTFSLIETGEELTRGDEPSPTRSAVMVRLQHSHVRYGAFQRLAYEENPDAIARLVAYCLDHLAPAGLDHADPFAAFLDWVVAGAARKVAAWHVAGFVHGVLNTDNMNVTGDSFDYGPWRFLPAWDMSFTAAYFDQYGLYAFGRQAEAVHWNLFQLAQALRRAAPAESLIPALKTWPDRLAEAGRAQALWRLGLAPQVPDADEDLVVAFEGALATSGIQPDRAWFDWRGRTAAPEDAYRSAAWGPFAERVAAYTAVTGARDHAYWRDEAPETMLIDEVEAIWAPIADADDWDVFEAKISALRRMGEAHGASSPSRP